MSEEEKGEKEVVEVKKECMFGKDMRNGGRNFLGERRISLEFVYWVKFLIKECPNCGRLVDTDMLIAIISKDVAYHKCPYCGARLS